MLSTSHSTDPLEIPAFLRVDAAEAERRKRVWDEHPPTTSARSGSGDERKGFLTDADVRKLREQQAKARAQEIAEAQARRPKKAALPAAQEVLVYRAGRWGFIQKSRLRKRERHYTAADLPSITSNAIDPAAASATHKQKAKSVPKKLERALGKNDLLMVELLRRPQGATAQELADATGRKTHSCTACFARFRRLGLMVNSEHSEKRGGRFYRID